MKRVSDKVNIETIRYWVQSAIYGAEQDGVDITVDVVKDYVGYDEQDPETQAWLDVIIDDEIENMDESQAKDYWREAEDKYLIGRRSDSKQSKNNNMKRIKDNDEYVPQDGDVIVIDYTIDEWQIEDYAQSWRCSEEAAVRRWFAEIVERYDGDISGNYIISHNPPKATEGKRPFTTTEDGNFNIYLCTDLPDAYYVAVSKADRAERLRKLGFFTECEYNDMYDYEYGVRDSRKTNRSLEQRIKDSVKIKTIRKKITDAKAKYFTNDLKRMQAFRRVTDSEGKIKENVVFLIEDSDVLAVFPNTYGTANRDRDTMVCYSHDGQHGVCTYDYANTLKTADSKQYNELKDELANYVGYNLTIVDSLPSETELKQNAKEIRDSYIKFRRGIHAIEDARMLARGEEIEYNGKRGTVQYALFHAQEPVVIRWTNEEGSEEFEIPYNQVQNLKIHDSEDDIDENIENVETDSDIDENEVADGCGKKGKKKTVKDNIKKVKVTKRQTKKSE